MNTESLSPAEFSALLKELHQTRRNRVARNRAPRQRLSAADRKQIFAKAGGRCHICGGLINGSAWEADHVQSHSTGGRHLLDNYLPAHATCNQYRWNFTPEEFQCILELGVWLRNQVEHGTPVGAEAAAAFLAHERTRARRARLTSATPSKEKAVHQNT